MSTTDDARLEALDRRGRDAARTLLDDLDDLDARDLHARASQAPDAGDAPSATTPYPGAPAGPEPTRFHLDRAAVRKAGWPARRRVRAAAAAAVLVAAAGAIALVTRDDGGPDVTSSGQADHLLPAWLPAGFAPLHAIDVPDAASMGFGYDVAVYGDPDTADPWSADVVVAHVVADEELLGDPPSGGEAVTVAGHEARLRREADTLGAGTTSPRWEVEWQVDDGRMIVSGALRRDEVLAAAEAATSEPAIDPSGLPNGYDELASGPFVDSVLFSSLLEGAFDGSGDGSGLAVTYADPSDRDAVRPAVVVAQRPGPASAVDLLRLSYPDADGTTVRGHHAVVGRGSELPGSAGEAGVVAIQWAEPDGQLVTVVGFGMAEDVVRQVAEGLRPASPDEVAALREQDAAAAPREFDPVPDGHVVVASGESPTGQWRIVADAERQANVGALTIDRLAGAIGSTSSTTGDRVEPPLDLSADFSDATAVVWGLLWVDAATVTVEAPGIEPVPLGLYEVAGWDHPVVAGAFPDDHFAGQQDAVDVVARDADGREVARNRTVLSPDG